MMRSDRHTVLLAVVALSLATSPLLAAAGPAKAPPRVTEEQAKQKAAVVAKALDLPWDESATATLIRMGTDPKDAHPDPPVWEAQCCGASIRLRGDTGVVLGFNRPRASTPGAGGNPSTKEEAVAAAARVLRLLGAAPETPPKEADESSSGWHLVWQRRTPDGIPYNLDNISATVDAAGRVVSAAVFWPSRPPGSTKAKVSREQAMGLALNAARRSGWLRTDWRTVTAELQIVRSRDFGRMLTRYCDLPTRLAWAVAIIGPAAGGKHVVAIDAASGKVLGSYSSLWAASPGPRAWAPQPQLTIWVALGVFAAALAAAAACLARRREERAMAEQEG